MGREVENLYIDHGGQAAEALGADAQRVDLVEDLQAQFLDRIGRAASFSSSMSIGAISDLFASSIAFSAVPPMPIMSTPGGHQPAPIVGSVLTTQSTMLSLGLRMVNLDLFSEPPPLAPARCRDGRRVRCRCR